MFRHIIRRTYNTIKSKNDEQANQALLRRLKQIPVLCEKRVSIKGDIDDESHRNLTFAKLFKLTRLHVSDPLTWNPFTLSRIFNLSHDNCFKLLHYTKPLVSYIDSTMEEATSLIKQPIIVDVAKLKFDKNYMIEYQRFAFIDEDHPIERRALE